MYSTPLQHHFNLDKLCNEGEFGNKISGIYTLGKRYLNQDYDTPFWAKNETEEDFKFLKTFEVPLAF